MTTALIVPETPASAVAAVTPVASTVTVTTATVSPIPAAAAVAIHVVPEIGALERAGRNRGLANNYYSRAFFEMLAARNRYTLAYIETLRDGHIAVCLQKTIDRPFMDDRKLLLTHIARRRGGKIYAGINNRGVYMRGRALAEALFLARSRQLLEKLFVVTRPLRHRLGLARAASQR